MRKLTMTLTAAALMLGTMAIAANAAQMPGAANFHTQIQNATPIKAGCLPRLRALVRARLRPGLRSVSLLVPPLLLEAGWRPVEPSEAASRRPRFLRRRRMSRLNPEPIFFNVMK